MNDKLGGLVSLVLTFALLATLDLSVSAHEANTFYPDYWRRDLAVNWRFENEVPTTGFRERVKEGAIRWNQLAPNMHFVKQDGDYANFDARSCPDMYQKDGVHWGNIDGARGTYAYRYQCVTIQNEIYNFQIKFDSSEDWYNNPSSDVPLDRLDTRSVATHEFGHATGFTGPYANGHFDPEGTLCQTSPIHTMCPFFSYGDGYWDTLEEHDKHTFFARYP